MMKWLHTLLSLPLVALVVTSDSKQCGEQFVTAIYQACGVARRAFSPIGHNMDDKITRKIDKALLDHLQTRSGGFSRQGGGGYFGQGLGGGVFKRSADASKLPPNYLLSLEKDDIAHGGDSEGFGSPINDLVPSSKLKDFNTLQDFQKYLKKTGQSQRELTAPDIQEITAEKRGNTAVNLMADYCCRHKCNWRTLVAICK